MVALGKPEVASSTPGGSDLPVVGVNGARFLWRSLQDHVRYIPATRPHMELQVELQPVQKPEVSRVAILPLLDIVWVFYSSILLSDAESNTGSDLSLKFLGQDNAKQPGIT